MEKPGSLETIATRLGEISVALTDLVRHIEKDTVKCEIENRTRIVGMPEPLVTHVKGSVYTHDPED
jgi:hypothetical protein